MLTITSPFTVTLNNACTAPEHQIKKGVVITARVHPGETNASWMMKGLLDFLLGDSADAKVCKKCLKIIFIFIFPLASSR
jgi:hypothetical protein